MVGRRGRGEEGPGAIESEIEGRGTERLREEGRVKSPTEGGERGKEKGGGRRKGIISIRRFVGVHWGFNFL